MDVRAVPRTLAAARRRHQLRAGRDKTGIQVGEEPLMPDLVASFLSEAIARSRFYLEFGAGASTVMASRLRVPTVSVENDQQFAAAVSGALDPEGEVTMLAVDIGQTEFWGYPVVTWRTPKRLKKWRRYTQVAIEAIAEADTLPDFVLIDGRFRRSCLLEVARLAASSSQTVTVLFDDYLGRAYYQSVERYVGRPELLERAAIFRLSSADSITLIDEVVLLDAASDYR